jgi:hypothetical protein
MTPKPDPCELDAPSMYSFHFLVCCMSKTRFLSDGFVSMGVNLAIKSASTFPLIDVLGWYLMSYAPS